MSIRTDTTPHVGSGTCHPRPKRRLVVLTSHLVYYYSRYYKFDEDGHDNTGAPPLSRDRIRPTWASAAKRNTRRQSEPAGTYSLVSLFSLLSSSSHSSSFWSSCLPRSAAMNWAGPDVTNPGGDRNAGLDGGCKGCVFCCFFSLVCLLSSVLLPSLLFFFYNDLFLRGVQQIV